VFTADSSRFTEDADICHSGPFVRQLADQGKTPARIQYKQEWIPAFAGMTMAWGLFFILI